MFGGSLSYENAFKVQEVADAIFAAIMSLPINLPFTPLGKALRARRRLEVMAQESIDKYRKQIDAISDDEIK